ncbi:hypothetical protein ACIQUF_24175 [Pseudomonas sp. NPDC090233]|uniref:hypothetical protein n=1 Tax=Pseudomonas sp. NPDC090233 TaxID=3364479 RepID=UPI00383AF95D
MKFLILLLLNLMLAACVSPPRTPSTNTTSTLDGEATAAALTEQYMDTTPRCNNSDTQPAFLCSGVIIRVTTYSDDYESWDPSPMAKKKRAVSFSYLRKDQNFGLFAYSRPNANGFIFYPNFKVTPERRIPVLCF